MNKPEFPLRVWLIEHENVFYINVGSEKEDAKIPTEQKFVAYNYKDAVALANDAIRVLKDFWGEDRVLNTYSYAYLTQ